MPAAKTYRQIYEQAYGPIPKDKRERPHQIHHLNLKKTDNRLTNLIAIPRSWHIVWHRLIKNLPLETLFRLAEGLMDYIIAEQKRINNAQALQTKTNNSTQTKII